MRLSHYLNFLKLYSLTFYQYYLLITNYEVHFLKIVYLLSTEY